MQIVDTPLPGVKVLSPEIYEDHRGFFMESYHRRQFAELGIDCEFVQDNHSRSSRGVLRGLHFQIGCPQAKLVRVILGRVFDVVVDIRRGSPTFGRWAGVELDDRNRLVLFAPEGFAHGFLVLSGAAEFQYKCSDFYSRKDERGLPWNDPTIGIRWPLESIDPLLSDRDRGWRPLGETDDVDLPVYAP